MVKKFDDFESSFDRELRQRLLEKLDSFSYTILYFDQQLINLVNFFFSDEPDFYQKMRTRAEEIVESINSVDVGSIEDILVEILDEDEYDKLDIGFSILAKSSVNRSISVESEYSRYFVENDYFVETLLAKIILECFHSNRSNRHRNLKLDILDIPTFYPALSITVSSKRVFVYDFAKEKIQKYLPSVINFIGGRNVHWNLNIYPHRKWVSEIDVKISF